jgi:hypothetical protein
MGVCDILRLWLRGSRGAYRELSRAVYDLRHVDPSVLVLSHARFEDHWHCLRELVLGIYGDM